MLWNQPRTERYWYILHSLCFPLIILMTVHTKYWTNPRFGTLTLLCNDATGVCNLDGRDNAKELLQSAATSLRPLAYE